MKKNILYFLVTLCFSVSFLSAQNNPWYTVKAKSVSTGNDLLTRPNLPTEFKVLSLNTNELQNVTSQANKTTGTAKRTKGVVISMPTPDAGFMDFEIFEQQDFEEALSKKFPELKSYTGYAVFDKSTEINFTVNSLGFNAVITSPNFSTIYIDTYSKDLSQYIIYYRKDLKRVKEFSCLDTNLLDIEEHEIQPQKFVKRSSDGIYRDYRIAIATTTEYSQFHINRLNAQAQSTLQKKAIVLSAIQTTLNRVNTVYKRDLAIHLTLVANNDDIIFIDTDSFNNTNANILISQSQTVIDNTIGNSNYDIGHTFSTGAGGLATLYTPCNPNSKARGVTGSTQPINDPYDIDYVAHEIGHQFGATHTFNNDCDSNREDATAYEPGSGSTIMAYAGICAPNVANNSDDYFHYISIKQIQDFIEGNGGTCPTNTILTNSAPNVNNIQNYTIPFGTAFKLSAIATDTDNDILTYGWEQLNNEITINPPLATNINGPAFKSIKPTTSNTRYFPNYTSVLNGNLTPQWEVISNVPRTYKFGLTVRDNNATGGQVTQKENTITVANTGPFIITAPESELSSWPKNSTQTVTWNVAGTNANGINTTNVNILLSTDGGQTFEMLVENTANDGTENVTVPNIATKDAVLMIEAVGNIFYTVSKKFSIGYKLIIENICNDYTLSYNAQNIAQAGQQYVFNFDVNEVEDFEIKNLKLATDIIASQTADVVVHFRNANETDIVSNIVYRNTQCNTTQNLKSVFENSGIANACNNVNTSSILKPNENFTAINQNANGQWKVMVSKINPNRNVAVNKLTLTLCGEKRSYIDLDNDIQINKEFVIYPNPSNGTFKFYLESKNNINITVFDMTGKLLLNKNIPATSVNIHDVNLAMLAKGVYIFKINDGKIKKSEKIIIN